jgi:hypothetical protein
MGIKKLNRFLLDNCSKHAIKKTHFKFYKGRTMVVDTSIYLYKFQSENRLLERMDEMVKMFKRYQIVPIFVFDGKPPPEKHDLIMKRFLLKKEAENKYYMVKNDMLEREESQQLSAQAKTDSMNELEQLKKQFIKINETHIHKVKQLLDAHGTPYIDAPEEADQLCAYLVKTNVAWACISDDMDMLVYGCLRVFRFLDITKHSAVYYDMRMILRDLSMSMELFREIMVLSGTDYNIHDETSLLDTFQWLYKYKKASARNEPARNALVRNGSVRNESTRNESNKTTFYEWLSENTTYIKNYEKLIKIYHLFDLKQTHALISFSQTTYRYTPSNPNEIQSILLREQII